MSIIKADISNLDQIVALSEMWNDDSTPAHAEIMERYITSETVFCAIEDDEILGIVMLEENSDGSQHLARLFVHPDYRNDGIGSEMMESVTTLLDETCTKSFLSVSNTSPSQSLYERFGYTETDTFKAPDKNYVPMVREPSLSF